MQVAKVIKSLLLFMLMLTLAGCGEQLSANKPGAGNKLDLQVQLGAAPSAGYRYVLLYSKVPINTLNVGDFFLMPGEPLPSSLPTNRPEPLVITSLQILKTYYYSHYFFSFSTSFPFCYKLS